MQTTAKPTKPATRYATALFPTGNPAAPVETRRVFVLELWESVSAALVSEVDTDGTLKADTFRHVLPLSRLASATTLARKRDAYAHRLASVPAGYCPACWGMGRARGAANAETCELRDTHRDRFSASPEAQRHAQMAVMTTSAHAALS